MTTSLWTACHRRALAASGRRVWASGCVSGRPHRNVGREVRQQRTSARIHRVRHMWPPQRLHGEGAQPKRLGTDGHRWATIESPPRRAPKGPACGGAAGRERAPESNTGGRGGVPAYPTLVDVFRRISADLVSAQKPPRPPEAPPYSPLPSPMPKPSGAIGARGTLAEASARQSPRAAPWEADGDNCPPPPTLPPQV